MTKTLEQYLLDCEDGDGCDCPLVDHALRFHFYTLKDGIKKRGFYIHPDGVSGDTLDFIIYGNKIIPLDEINKDLGLPKKYHYFFNGIKVMYEYPKASLAEILATQYDYNKHDYHFCIETSGPDEMIEDDMLEYDLSGDNIPKFHAFPKVITGG